MYYKKVTPNIDNVKLELNIENFWKQNNIFEKSILLRKEEKSFAFYDGPPTANGKPHIGHILTRAVKDLIPRYKTMKGYKVLRRAGWDTHGLPVELEIEKELKISGKTEIENYGIEKFIKKCKESVWKYEKQWKDVSNRVGFWADMENPYITYSNEYIESVWWALKEIWNKNLIYKGHKVVPYCPRCGTALSSHEVAQGYKEVKDKSAYVKFKLKNKENEYFLAWTTTPWTLPSNVALVVNKDEYYAKIKLENEIYIIAEALVDKVLKEKEYSIIDKIKGEKLEYIEYEPIFDFVKIKDKKAFIVTCDNYVTLTDGTGIVHCAPAFGEDDARVGKNYNLEFIQLVNEEGKFKKEVKQWENIFVKDADIHILKELKNKNKLFKSENYLHSYPFCWRCDTPLIYYARNTWFIKMTKLRNNLTKNNKTVNWIPENIKEGRFGNFLQNVIDWSLSRERYWGTPLPIWQCECGYSHVVGSIEELKKMADSIDENIELHKPYIDNIFLNCPKCNKKMKRVPEVIDCWFDSGSMPFAQFHYPFENKDLFEKNYPANFISEAVDQTRGWFYTLMAISTLLFDKSPYKNVIVLGHVQDKYGQKMSKHKGNVVDPWEVLNKQGADAIRWYFYSNSAPWLPSRFYDEAVNEYKRKFIGTLWNTYSFYILYSNIDNFNPKNYKLNIDTLTIMDKWILSKLNNLINSIDNYLENYKITEAARTLDNFVDNLSNWYVRRSRERFWAEGMEIDKINAYMTLNHVLINLIHLSAPFVPFITEEIYQNLVKNIYNDCYESVHLSDFPKLDEKLLNENLENKMEQVLNIVYLGRAARNQSNIKNRQPLKKMYVKLEKSLENDYIDIIKEELNIKEIKFIKNTNLFTEYKFKPQLRTLGPKYGKLLQKISRKLKELDNKKLSEEIEKKGYFIIKVDEKEIKLTKEDLIIEHIQKEGFVVCQDKNITIILDINLSKDLIEEGFVREIVSKIQTMRKEANYEILDKIKIYYKGNEKIKNIIDKNIKVILRDVLAKEILQKDITLDYTKVWDINGETVKFSIKKQ